MKNRGKLVTAMHLIEKNIIENHSVILNDILINL
jgi:hypothetical protein